MSRYNLYLSNKLKQFVSSYGHVFHSNSLLGEKVYLVVQNRSIGEWLKLELARKYGISANLNIVLPENAVRTFVRSFPLGRQMLSSTGKREEKAVLFMDNLKVIIYKKLEELLRTDLSEKNRGERLFYQLENYIKGTGTGEGDFQTINSLRLYQLSDSIAGLFYYYGMNCQELISSWKQGISFFADENDPAICSHEKWQMALWNQLFNEQSPYIHLSSILAAIVENNDLYNGEPLRVILFGSAFMGDTSLRFFRHLSRFVQLDHFVLSPSYSDQPFTSPLLKSWGSLYEGFRGLITSLSEGQNDQVQRDFEENDKNTLLSNLQNMMLYNRTPDEKIKVAEDDWSLSIVSTTGRWREVEALKNRIIKLLDEDPELQLTDIGVLAPDINEYGHYIEAIFPRQDSVSIPFNIIDLKGEGDSPFIRGFLSLLNLTGSRFTRKDLFSLFSNSCFAESASIDISEYSNWLTLCDQLNIKWAVDEKHKEELNVRGGVHNSWEKGFDRLLEGLALSEDEIPYEAPFPLFNESDSFSAGKMMHIVRSLHGDLNSLKGVKLRLEEWVLLWETIMDHYLSPADNSGRDSRDRLRLKGCFRDILNMVNELDNFEDLDDRNFDFFMFKSLLMEFVSKSGGSRGRYLTQGISCASLKPLRAVPFKVIMVLGLDEEAFPAADESLSFDLKETEKVQNVISIDLSRRTSDKYSFLEVFLSAEQKVILFYKGRDNVGNEILQPSSLISELAGFVDDHFMVKNRKSCFAGLVEHEKLQPFDREYFSSDSMLFSFSERDYQLARVYYGEKTPPEDSIRIDSVGLPEEDIVEITFRDLLAFLKNPLKFFYNRSCGVYREDEELKEEDSEENVEAHFFLERAFLEEIILEPEIDENVQNIEERIEHYTLLQSARGELLANNLSAPSLERTKEKAVNLISLADGYSQLIAKPEPKILIFGDETDQGKGIIQSPLYTLDDGRKIRIRGAVPPLYFFNDGAVVSIEIVSSKQVKMSHWFSSFLISSLLPIGLLKSKGLKAYLVSNHAVSIALYPVDEDRKYITGLLQSYMNNLESPLPLYNEVAEGLIHRGQCPEPGAPGEFKASFQKRWNTLLSGFSSDYSIFKNCPYRSKAYENLPDFDEEQMTRFFYSVYRPISEAIRRGKEKK